MEQAEFEGHYERLKDELARAYASPAWNSPHIDRLARELLAIELIASSKRGGGAFLFFQGPSDGRRAGEECCPNQPTVTTRPSC